MVSTNGGGWAIARVAQVSVSDDDGLIGPVVPAENFFIACGFVYVCILPVGSWYRYPYDWIVDEGGSKSGETSFCVHATSTD